jgi:hypothetical protein
MRKPMRSISQGESTGTAKRADGRALRQIACAGLFVLPLLAIVLLAPHRGLTQSAPAPVPTKPLPSRILYRQLFKHVLFLENQADYADQHGRNGNALRSYYQQRGKLTPAEAAALKRIAKQAEDDIKKIDGKIKAEIIQYRSVVPAAKPHSKSTVPPPPDLIPLQREKDSAVLAQAAALQAVLGKQKFQDFDAFARRELTPHVKVTNTPTTPGH